VSRFVALAVSLAGCLSVPDAHVPACTTNDDCNSGAGEVCETGTCWGNPPDGTFAATLSPPVERNTELVPMELPVLGLPDDGWIGDVTFESPVSYAGRVEAYCTNPIDCTSRLSLDATITITRPPLFHGGTGFKTVVVSQPGVETGTSFKVALPMTHPTDAAYTITVVPGGRDLPGTTTPNPAELVPPMRATLTVSASKSDVIELGSGKLTVIDGKLGMPNGIGIPNYRVIARGHWDASAPVDEVSSVAFTKADGHFAILLSDNLAGTVELVAEPIGTAVGASLHLPNLDPTATATRNLVMPAELGTPKMLNVLVNGGDGSGKVAPIEGARVVVRTSVKPSATSDLFVTTDAEVTSNANGLATLQVLDGSLFTGKLHLCIVPPAGASVGAVYDELIERLDRTEMLMPRVALTGIATDSQGTRLGGVAVTAHPALRFTWSLDDDGQDFLAQIPPATTVTNDKGEFVVWVDHGIDGVPGTYDLTLEPSGDTRSARWDVQDLMMPAMTPMSGIQLDPIAIPDAAFIHGRIVDLDGLDVEGAELKLFRIETSLAVCSQVTNAPPSCPIPARLQGRGASDLGGLVRLSLPRP
jgi:hypothetical protein